MPFATGVLPAVLSAVLAAAPSAAPQALPSPARPGPAAAGQAPGAAAAPYDGQPLHPTALFGVKSPDHAAAQEFTVDSSRVTRVSVYVASAAATGSITAQIRRDRADPASALASRTVTLASLGGAGAGWLEFPLTADVTPGTTYHLHLQATTAESGNIAWYGTKNAVPGSLTSWNHDRAYWGGWHADPTRLAFHVNPSGSERCGETEPCYVPATALAARTAGLLSNGTAVEAVAPSFAVGASYVDGSNVLRLPSGRWRHLPDGATASVVVPAEDPGARAQIEESRAWLASGRVPGAGTPRQAAAERALLSLRALLRPNGAFAAGWAPAWEYSWPSDEAFAAVAFAATGHDEEAYRILRYDAATQRPDGTWEARTRLDGSGPPDARPWQLDGNGWVPWATWHWYRQAPAADREARLRALYPMVRKAADHAAGSLGADGLPPASPDYWELGTDSPNIGTAAPLLAGLNAAADLAAGLGETGDRDRWADAARRLSAGIAASFAPGGYPRTADGRHGRDSAAAFMAPPVNDAPPGLAAALDSTHRALLLPNGGLSPGNDPGFSWGSYAWTASTSFFAVAWAHTGEGAKADRVLDWVLSKRNGLGELPETVNGSGRPSAVVPLGWTGALLLIAALARDGAPLPAPPLRR
ncbi:choice-of-anchor R domain-containing protein [Streptomyces globosus]|uniref:choice-of-anchor R domain-containing protein n=1 Tax=Streptomyces globosus TaxID=68209 RepID=UPI0031E20ACE